MSAFGIKRKYGSVAQMTSPPILDFVRKLWTSAFQNHQMGKGYDPQFLDRVIGKSIPEIENYLTVKGIIFQLGEEPLKVAIPDPRGDSADSITFDDYRCLIINREMNKRVLMRYDLYMADSVVIFGQQSFDWKNPYQF